MYTAAELEWILEVIGAGTPGALAVFEVSGDALVLAAANDAYMSLFPVRGPDTPVSGAVVTTILPGDDRQLDRIVGNVLDGDSFMAESWAIPAPPGTYTTGVAYCDWSLKKVAAFGDEAVVLLLTDATRRTERNQGLAEEVVRLRDATDVVTESPI